MLPIQKMQNDITLYSENLTDCVTIDSKTEMKFVNIAYNTNILNSVCDQTEAENSCLQDNTNALIEDLESFVDIKFTNQCDINLSNSL